MENRHCKACSQIFQPRPQSPHQSYCSGPSCKAQRKRQWRKNKFETDPDYHDNQKRAQQAWVERNPDYWREYRKSHPKYADRNRSLQRDRNRKARTRSIAKMDASIPPNSLPTGIYQLSRVTDNPIAKIDVWIVEISAHACDCSKS